MQFDFVNNVKLEQAITPVAAIVDNNAVVGLPIKTQGSRSRLWIINVGAVGDAGSLFTVTFENSDDVNFGTFNVMTSLEIILPSGVSPNFKQTSQNSARTVGTIGTLLYERIRIQPSSVTTATFFNAVCALDSLVRPVIANTPQ